MAGNRRRRRASNPAIWRRWLVLGCRSPRPRWPGGGSRGWAAQALMRVTSMESLLVHQGTGALFRSWDAGQTTNKNGKRSGWAAGRLGTIGFEGLDACADQVGAMSSAQAAADGGQQGVGIGWRRCAAKKVGQGAKGAMACTAAAWDHAAVRPMTARPWSWRGARQSRAACRPARTAPRRHRDSGASSATWAWAALSTAAPSGSTTSTWVRRTWSSGPVRAHQTRPAFLRPMSVTTPTGSGRRPDRRAGWRGRRFRARRPAPSCSSAGGVRGSQVGAVGDSTRRRSRNRPSRHARPGVPLRCSNQATGRAMVVFARTRHAHGDAAWRVGPRRRRRREQVFGDGLPTGRARPPAGFRCISRPGPAFPSTMAPPCACRGLEMSAPPGRCQRCPGPPPWRPKAGRCGLLRVHVIGAVHGPRCRCAAPPPGGQRRAPSGRPGPGA